MNNNFQLQYSPTFYEDFTKIIFYIRYELKNNIAAHNLINLVETEIIKRSQNPLGYEQFKTKRNNIFYKIFIKNFIVFYTISDITMEIRRIVYNKRDYKNLL